MRYAGLVKSDLRGKQRAFKGNHMVERQVLVSLLKIHDLPTLPEVIRKILEAVQDESSSASDLTSILEADHTISARILRLANSAFYGQVKEVGSIRRAVVVLGFDAVRHLALATSVFDTLSKRRQFSIDPEDFWMHSLGAAKASQLLCDGHCQVESPSICFTAGLLHDIGKYLLALVLKDDYKAVVEAAEKSERMLLDVEMEILGFGHSEAGAWIAKKWKFPELIIEAIRNVHDATAYEGPNREEVALVALADAVSLRAGFGRAGDWGPPPATFALTGLLGIPESTVDDLVEQLSAEKKETREFFNLLKQG